MGLIARLDHVLQALDTELKAAQDGLDREETNLASYTEQSTASFEHQDALQSAQHDLARIERKLSGQADASSSARLDADTDSVTEMAA